MRRTEPSPNRVCQSRCWAGSTFNWTCSSDRSAVAAPPRWRRILIAERMMLSSITITVTVAPETMSISRPAPFCSTKSMTLTPI